jgi:hypothetical protein
MSSGPIVNLLDTQIVLVEAEEGIAIIPSFGLPVAIGRSSLARLIVRHSSGSFPSVTGYKCCPRRAIFFAYSPL